MGPGIPRLPICKTLEEVGTQHAVRTPEVVGKVVKENEIVAVHKLTNDVAVLISDTRTVPSADPSVLHSSCW